MGNTHSTQQPLTQQPPTRERLILSNVEQKSKRSKSYRKSYKQRGGNVQDFAFYAEDLETSNLIENNVQIALDI